MRGGGDQGSGWGNQMGLWRELKLAIFNCFVVQHARKVRIAILKLYGTQEPSTVQLSCESKTIIFVFRPFYFSALISSSSFYSISPDVSNSARCFLFNIYLQLKSSAVSDQWNVVFMMGEFGVPWREESSLKRKFPPTSPSFYISLCFLAHII